MLESCKIFLSIENGLCVGRLRDVQIMVSGAILLQRMIHSLI